MGHVTGTDAAGPTPWASTRSRHARITYRRDETPSANTRVGAATARYRLLERSAVVWWKPWTWQRRKLSAAPEQSEPVTALSAAPEQSEPVTALSAAPEQSEPVTALVCGKKVRLRRGEPAWRCQRQRKHTGDCNPLADKAPRRCCRYQHGHDGPCERLPNG